MDLAVIDICKKTIRDSIENEVLHEMVPRLIYLDNMPRSVVVLPVPEEKCEETGARRWPWGRSGSH